MSTEYYLRCRNCSTDSEFSFGISSKVRLLEVIHLWPQIQAVVHSPADLTVDVWWLSRYPWEFFEAHYTHELTIVDEYDREHSFSADMVRPAMERSV